MRGSIPKEGVTRRSVITPDVIRLDAPRETRGALFEDGRGTVDRFSVARRVIPNVKDVVAASPSPDVVTASLISHSYGWRTGIRG